MFFADFPIFVCVFEASSAPGLIDPPEHVAHFASVSILDGSAGDGPTNDTAQVMAHNVDRHLRQPTKGK